ncbi:T9SS type A sorting domain-containing protein [uncultured Algibacter sp.]|uniref:T9SS type A sorting domain-containing protein n=1 Tax=uncultured Algibacter sp. TaxID=298659 RepID=UPI0026183AAE|nr:T9SS type A sorting domain-containing protein [uncultured Algibacter sp.]
MSKTYAQLHPKPNCGQNFNLNWTTSRTSDDHYWQPGSLSNTYTNVNNSGIDITIEFTGDTDNLGYWSGQTPKVGTQSSYLYKGIDLLTNGLSNEGITCTVTFSKPVYAFSFDIHHINVINSKGDKYTFTGKDKNGNTIYPEFTNSTQPTYTSNNDTGVVNATANLSSGTNSIVGVNYADNNHIKSISFLWEDCDTCNPNELHATGIGNISFCTVQTIDFDGENDYINREAFLGGRSEVTMMSWIKLDDGFNSGDIMGQRNFRIYIDSNKHLKAFLKSNTGKEVISQNLSNIILKDNLWYHVALKFNGNTGEVALLLNGDIIWNYSEPDLKGSTIIDTEEWNLNHDFEIGRNTEFDNNYFKGSIYECKVFNKDLSINQLHQQINQEIENSLGNIKGIIIPKDIEGLNWNDLILYYNMKNVDTGFVQDLSNSNTNGKLNNMGVFQENQDFTAPLPYITTSSSSGNFTGANNWIHGDVWDITESIPLHSIIQVNGNLKIYEDITTLGLIINENATLKINQNSALYNSWYLKVNGILDLDGDSQLIQTENSTLDLSSSGILEKDLKGTADKFTYNYWSSPVQNTKGSYTTKGIFTNVDFLTTGHDGVPSPVSIADYWIWKFTNNTSDNYSSWLHVRSLGEILAGEGFTMKGPGTGSISDEQNYIIQGKPNNGDINLTVYAGNDYLIGNPYPSAIDAIQFIKDNKSSNSDSGAINGTLYFWKHWGGGSHLASEYQGGYASYSLSGGVPAASTSVNNTISSGGSATDIPSRYIPSGQGFYTTAETNGTINFNNGQRVFYIEETEDIAYKQVKKSNKATSITNDTRMKLRIGFESVNTLQRQLLITVDENATEGYDWGYDSKYIDTQIDDMYWLINKEKFIIQGINQINKNTKIPLGIHTKTDGLNSIKIDKLEYTPQDLEIYLHDKYLNIYHDLKTGKYETRLASGVYLNRFEITFSKNQTLGTEENENKEIEVYFSNKKNSIVINNPASKRIEAIEMFNILGQTLFKFNTNSNNSYIEYNANEIKTGNYILKIETEFGTISKKISIK